MARAMRHRCKDCGTTSEQTPISARGLCGACAATRHQREIDRRKAVATFGPPADFDRALDTMRNLRQMRYE